LVIAEEEKALTRCSWKVLLPVNLDKEGEFVPVMAQWRILPLMGGPFPKNPILLVETLLFHKYQLVCRYLA
jgi:hypothetical protein